MRKFPKITSSMNSWALYDFANSSFSSIVQTFVFATYFTEHVAKSHIAGTQMWGFANGISALFIAFLGPILGAIADKGKNRKVWLFFFTYLSICSTGMLWFVEPDPSYTMFALTLASIGIIGAELSFVFYNAMLPEIAPPRSIGKWSGWGWGCGYAGGVLSLTLSLVLFVNDPPLIPIEGVPMGGVRATFPLTSIWYCLFSIPLLLFVPTKYGEALPFRSAIRMGARELKKTLTRLSSYKQTVRFLIASMIFRDGLTTLFAFGGVFAATLFGMSAKEILAFGIAMNIFSGIGAVTLGSLDDIIGPKRLIMFSLIGLIITTAGLLSIESAPAFWTLGLILALFVGPVQSASRSYMARAAPPTLRNEMFGFYALTGKATAFTGPILVGWTTGYTGNERAGLSVIVLFFIIGLLLMLTLPKIKNEKSFSTDSL